MTSIEVDTHRDPDLELEPREVAEWDTSRAAPVVVLLILAATAGFVAVMAAPIPVTVASGLIALAAAVVAAGTACRKDEEVEQ